jgi:RimJ/RimL family protein N-acetyltransferase
VPPIALPEPPLAGAAVALRPCTTRDTAWIVHEAADPLVPRFTSVPEHYDTAAVAAWMRRQAAERESGVALVMLTVEQSSGALVGPVGLHRIDWVHRVAEVGYWTAHAMRSRGYTTEGVRLLCGWGFTALGLERIELRAEGENTGSRAVARRAGFTFEGILRGALDGPGRRRSVALYAALPGELT